MGVDEFCLVGVILGVLTIVVGVDEVLGSNEGVGLDVLVIEGALVGLVVHPTKDNRII